MRFMVMVKATEDSDNGKARLEAHKAREDRYLADHFERPVGASGNIPSAPGGNGVTWRKRKFVSKMMNLFNVIRPEWDLETRHGNHNSDHSTHGQRPIHATQQ